MQKSISMIYIYIYLFLMIYKPAIIPFSMNYIVTILAMIGIILLKGNIFKIKKKSNTPIRTIVYTTILTIIFLSIVLNFTSKDFSFIRLYGLFFAYSMQAYYAYLLFARYRISYNKALSMVINVGYFQCALCVIMMLLPGVRNAILSIIIANLDDSEKLLNAVDSRLYGVAGEYMYTIGLIHGVLSLYLVYKSIQERRMSYAFGAIIMLIPSILNARIGVICAAASIAVYASLILLKNNGKNLRQIIKIIFISSIVIFIGMKICEAVIPSTYQWILDGFQAVIDLATGTENQYYSKLTSDFLVWPSGINFWFGLGVRPAGIKYFNRYGYTSDIGYVLDVHIGGIIMAAIFYLGYIKMILYGWKDLDSSQRALRIAYIVFIAIANYKGRIAGAPEVMIILMIIVGIHCFTSEKELDTKKIV